MANKNLMKAAVIAFGVAILGWALLTYVNGSSSYFPETMANKSDLPPLAGGPAAADAVHANPKSLGGNAVPVGSAGGVAPTELLPSKGMGSDWSAANPSGLGQLSGQNFLSAGVHMGVNTIGSTKKNATHDIRAEPINPKVNVSPWLNSSFEPDTMRRGLGDVGGMA